jgi:soluble lytic murein transglycosylase-like protein
MIQGAIRCALLALMLGGTSSVAVAGNQQYERLAASVQGTLYAAVADRASPRLIFATEQEGTTWLADMSARLAKHIPNEQTRIDFLTTVQYETKRAGLDTQLVLGVIDTESKFRKYAVSRAGARGYMQVMPFWTGVIGTDRHNLFNLRTNLRYGCVILRHYLDIERGDLQRALARYNGSLGKKSGYADKVLNAWRSRWMLPQGTSQPLHAVPVRYVGEQ